MRSPIFLFIFLVLSFVPTGAQDQARVAVLVDSFERIQCEDARARMDNFMAELANNPSDRGVIVVHPKTTDPLWAFRQLQEFLAQARFRNFEMDRLDAKIGPARSKALIELWRVPEGVTRPEAKPSDVGADDIKFSIKKAVQFGTTDSSEESGCVSMPFDIEAYALALKYLNGVKGSIVVKGPKAKEALKKMKERLSEMSGYGVEKPIVRATFTKAKREVTELWIEPVPVKR